MKQIQQCCQTYLAAADVEHHSALGKACQYVINHYQGLTQFYQVESAPVDNNNMEEGLKICIRTRKNSHFYKTENGASIASVLISLISTAYRNAVNPFHFLNAVQRHYQSCVQNADAWLPWAIPAKYLK